MEFCKSDIQKLIQVKKSNTFWNHFLFSFSKNYKIHGEIQKNSIVIWQRTSFTGISYPIYIFEFDSENTLLNISDKLNPYAKYTQLLFPIFFFFPLLSTAFTDFQIKKFLTCISIFILLTVACYLMGRKIHSYEKREQLAHFRELLNIKTKNKSKISKILNIENKEKPENELSVSKTLTRLFTYPFCLALIGFAIFGMIPDGKFIIAIPLLAITVTYLYSDLKMILNQKK